MNFKVVYVLVSSTEDFYTEQAIMSMVSLRDWHPRCNITLVSDKETVASFSGHRAEIMQLADKVITPELPFDIVNSPKKRSRYLKTSLRPLIEGNFLYLDCDTIVTGNLDGLDRELCDVMAVVNAHDISCHRKSKQLQDYLKMSGKDFDYNYPYYNGGVIFTKDTPLSRDFFKVWHELWLTDLREYAISRDMFALALANSQLNGVIKELPGQYNCQIEVREGARCLYDAKIVHYWAEGDNFSGILLKNKEFWKNIREHGVTNVEKAIVNNLKRNYFETGYYLTDKEFSLFNSLLTRIGYKLSKIFHRNKC